MGNKNIIILIFIAVFVAVVFFVSRPANEHDDNMPKSRQRVPVVAGFKQPNEEAQVNNGETVIEPLKILAVGDIMLDRYVGTLIKKHDTDWLFASLLKTSPEFFAKHDLIMANLEGAVTNKGAHYPPVASNDFAFAPNLVKDLGSYNFNYFSIANNHIVDQGQKGYIETTKNLALMGFNYSGAPDSQVDHRSVYIKQIDGRKIAMVALSMVYNDFDLTKAQTLITEAETRSDLQIINIHWGKEYETQFNEKQQLVGQALIDAGADLIIGHHPHVFQGMEIYKNKAIFYSLGNFIFDQYWSAETQRGLAIGIVYQNQVWQFHLFGLGSKMSQPYLVTDTAKDKFLADFASRSKLEKKYLEQIKSGVITLE